MTDLSLNILYCLKTSLGEISQRYPCPNSAFTLLVREKNFKNYYLTVLDKVNSLKLLT